MAVVEVVQLLVSPVHRCTGRPSDGPSPAHDGELVSRAEIRANLGIVGDRYFNRPAHRNAAVTLMAAENLPVDINPAVDLRLTRRNVLLRGIDIDALVGKTVSLDTGEGPVLLSVRRPARPCAWMDTFIGPGAHRALRDKGGVRCTPLTDGWLTLGPAEFKVLPSVPG
ncbi:molybdenum cofactor biosysynthesis protein [Streptomyces sp. NPDC002133]|uniref:molybdenum cofactor biosysynthesis protein n=1 Tax=Streptomyces sp. NPDC002133 TaxID=3154409 RepID=UPI003332C605